MAGSLKKKTGSRDCIGNGRCEEGMPRWSDSGGAPATIERNAGAGCRGKQGCVAVAVNCNLGETLSRRFLDDSDVRLADQHC